MNPVFSAPEIGASDLPHAGGKAFRSLYWDFYARHRAGLASNPAGTPISRIYGAAVGRSSLFLQEPLPQGCGSSVIHPKIIVSDA
jgi:hypothetical protein